MVEYLSYSSPLIIELKIGKERNRGTRKLEETDKR